MFLENVQQTTDISSLSFQITGERCDNFQTKQTLIELTNEMKIASFYFSGCVSNFSGINTVRQRCFLDFPSAY